jgi:outer membrane protein OmpA-like peptidoglycan-associated protein
MDSVEKGKDADNDGKSDVVESAKLDADNDGVVDELDADDNNPNNDSDNDGFSNIDEKNAGTNPLDVNEHPQPKEPVVTKVDTDTKAKIEKEISDILALENIEFEVNKANLTEKGKAVVDKVAEVLKRYPNVRVRIEGHTDSDGKAEYNKQLSKDRVDRVKAELIMMDIDSNRLETVGFGESQPLVPNSSRANKAKNRRVEFKVIGE